MSIDVLQAKIRKTKNPSMSVLLRPFSELPCPSKTLPGAVWRHAPRRRRESYRQFSFGILTL